MSSNLQEDQKNIYIAELNVKVGPIIDKMLISSISAIANKRNEKELLEYFTDSKNHFLLGDLARLDPSEYPKDRAVFYSAIRKITIEKTSKIRDKVETLGRIEALAIIHHYAPKDERIILFHDKDFASVNGHLN